MSFRSNLGQAVPVSQGGFGAFFPGAFPVGVTGAPPCPSGFLAAPSATIPGGYTCVRAPGSYSSPMYMSGKR